LIEKFNLKKVSKSAAIFDYQKLKWLNREHIRLLADKELGEMLVPFMRQAGFDFEENVETIDWIGKAAKILSNYNYLLSEIAGDFKQFTTSDISEEIIGSIKNSESASKVISILFTETSKISSPVEFGKVAEITKKIQAESGIKGKELYHPIRLALTGKDSGIELKDFIPIIEKGSVLGIKPAVQNMEFRLKKFV
jgi:nondiscriminating glutamyl-tRNA synthetase